MLDVGTDAISTADTQHLVYLSDVAAAIHRRAAGRNDALWPARECLVVRHSGGPEGQVLLRRASRILSHATGNELHEVQVSTAGGLPPARLKEPEQQRQLTKEPGGPCHAVTR
ncbi:hypothetical protein HER39_17370 [Arthrobacter deserti]|uniref:Uncharacterized protein n=1 Tax=Arthrobacter deserti TaxID=1742687 RepID=A0ABX1JX13_9MICC|nr:hypothetical protein [Arthrobacter deserti]